MEDLERIEERGFSGVWGGGLPWIGEDQQWLGNGMAIHVEFRVLHFEAPRDQAVCREDIPWKHVVDGVTATCGSASKGGEMYLAFDTLYAVPHVALKLARRG